MKNIGYFRVLTVFLVAAYLLTACGGTLPQNTTSLKGPKVEANVTAFTGIVESINGNELMVNGQKITLDPQTSLDPNIQVGDKVNVEANVSADGSVVAIKVESTASDDPIATASAGASSTPDPASTSSPDASKTPAADSSPDAPQSSSANANEVFGSVDAITADSVTVNGVTYRLTNFTEVKDVLTAGDQVKLHLIVNADGTVTVREIEKSVTSFDDNSNSGGSDDGPNHDANDDHSNGNSSDDHDDDGPNHDSDDEHDDNSNSGSDNSDD